MLNCQKELLNNIKYGISEVNHFLNMDLYCDKCGICGSIVVNMSNPKYHLGDLLERMCKKCQK